MTNQPEPAPAVWMDGDPLMEAIASAVWEQCERSDSGLVIDDPRNIAAVATSVARATVAPATDQAALRELAADALADAEGWQWAPGYDKAQSPTYRHYLRQAEAVLSVLPASVGRAAVLLEAADFVGNDDECDCGGCDTCIPRKLADELRRMAAESVPAVAGNTGDETQGEAQLPFIHVDDDGDRLDIGTVMASTYDGEAPVVYVAAEQHQGDTLATVYVRPERVDEVIAALRSARLAAETLPAAGAQQPKETRP
jgi:hypothetical protein